MTRRIIPVALAVLALSGCSQVSALAPVGGDDVSEVRFATIDVLLSSHVEVLEAPTCSLDGETITCAGTTMDGDAIASTSGTTLDSTLEVTVGGASIFSGTLGSVLDAGAEG